MADHAKLSPSASSRWMACPGSVREELKFPDSTSRYASEGSAAHSLGEMALKTGKDPDAWLGRTISADGEDFKVDADMVEAVTVYTDEVYRILKENPDAELHVEKKLVLPPDTIAGATVYGTADAAIEVPFEVLFIRDYKHGAGVPVSAKNNSQTRIYGLGGLADAFVDQVDIGIVQPRVRNPVKDNRERLTIEEINGWRDNVLVPAVKATQAPDAPLVAGDHCRFCKAKALCPALQAKAQDTCRLDFSAIPDPTRPAQLPNVQDMGPLQLESVLQAAPAIELWLKAVREHAKQQLESGNHIPGFKLVAGRKTRVFVSPKGIADTLVAGGIPEHVVMTEPDVRSVAQMEKALKAHGLDKDAIKGMLSRHITYKESSPTVAPESDRRKAITVGQEFGKLP